MAVSSYVADVVFPYLIGLSMFFFFLYMICHTIRKYNENREREVSEYFGLSKHLTNLIPDHRWLEKNDDHDVDASGRTLYSQKKLPRKSNYKKEIHHFNNNYTLNNVPYKRVLTLLSPVFFWILWIVFQFPSGNIKIYEPVIFVFMIMSLLFLNTIFYIDNNIINTIIEIRPAFDTDDDSYYRFFLLFIDRVYEPVHVFSGEQIRSSHGPSIIGILILIISTFLLQFSPGAPVKKPTLQHGYLVFLTLLGLFGIIIFIWILITFFVYMSLKIDDFRIHIAPPVSPKNLGLTAYSNFIIGISIRLIISFVLGIFLIFQSPSPFIIFNVILASLLFICWIISTQYGLHNAIIYSKKDFYKNNIYYSNSTSREKLLSNYDKLKNIPNWPVGTGQIAEIIISSLLPIISVLLRFYALI